MRRAGDTVLAAQLEERRRESLLSRVEGKAGGFNSISPGFGLLLPEQIAEVLADEIIERKLASGSKLPEPALAERFGTSRAPIREALYLLDQAGLVERTPRRGTVVKAYSSREIEELYQVHITLERIALERICEAPEMVDSCLARHVFAGSHRGDDFRRR
jgi:DNA-binding GntR family transcriptional regulator